MSQKRYLPLAMMPVMAMMMVSPMKMSGQRSYRGIAAVESTQNDLQKKKEELLNKVEKQTELRRYNEVADRYNKENPHQVDNALTRADYVRDLKGFYDVIEDERKTLPKEIEDKSKIKEARNRIEGEVFAFAKAEKDFEDLKLRKIVDAKDVEVIEKFLKDSKGKLEDLLKQVEDDQPEVVALVHEENHVKDDKKPEEKKEEKVVKAEEKKEESSSPKKEDDTLVKAICEQNRLMSENMAKLMEDQKNIMQMMVSMMQSMMNYQQTQSALMQQQNLYQYYPQQQMPGNWVYQPNGFQQGMSSFGMQMPTYAYANPSLFSGPPSFNAGMGQQGQQSAAVSGSWGLRPDQNFQLDPRFSSPMVLSPGNFGGGQSQELGNFGMNMSPGTLSPVPSFQTQQQSQMPFQPQMMPQMQPQMQQVPFSVPSTSPQFNIPTQFV